MAKRERWVQSNTEFHQDWTADQNRGEQIKWKQGVSLEENSTQRYAAKVVVRQRVRWKLWLGILAFGIALVVADQIIALL
jgi:hypothetical protein